MSEAKDLPGLAEAARDLYEVAKEYEWLEAMLVVEGDWSGEFPRLTKSVCDHMLRCQTLRNQAVRKAEEGQP